MPEYVANDASFIATRLKEIEEEKRKVREKPATDDKADPINEGLDLGDWTGY